MRFKTLDEWLQWQQTLHPSKIDLGLERVQAVLDRLALRQPPFRVLTVAGTNGKGSSVALLSSVLQAAGLRVGTFTSPHLFQYNERICVQGAPIEDEQLLRCFHTIDAARGDTSLTYFEFCTLAGLLHFARQHCDVAVLEVGLGGRLDAVNAVDGDGALIVNVGIDHCRWLGDTRESIGREKAGVFRSGRPAVIADRQPPASVRQHAAAIGAPLVCLGEHFDWRERAERWHYLGPTRTWLSLPRPALPGRFQLDNSAGVLALLEALPWHWQVPRAAVRRGLREVRLPGRLQRVERAGVEWVLDVAHNAPGAAQLATELERLPPRRHTWALFAAMQDKDLPGMIQPLLGLVDDWWVCPLDSPRAAAPDDLQALLRAARARVHGADNVDQACHAIAQQARPGDRVIVFGSFYLVGPALQALGLYSRPVSQVG